MSQRRRRCQLSFKEALHGLAEWARHARTEPGEAAQLWYRGTVGPIARVYGPGGASVRPRRRVATRVSIVSGIEKKDDLKLNEYKKPYFVDDARWAMGSGQRQLKNRQLRPEMRRSTAQQLPPAKRKRQSYRAQA